MRMWLRLMKHLRWKCKPIRSNTHVCNMYIGYYSCIAKSIHINLRDYICKLNNYEDSHFLQGINQKNYRLWCFDSMYYVTLTFLSCTQSPIHIVTVYSLWARYYKNSSVCLKYLRDEVIPFIEAHFAI